MKQSPQEREIYQNFQPGGISKEGFLGEDNRHIHDIIAADQKILRKLGLNCKLIGDRLQFFIDEGKKGLESSVDLGDFQSRILWQRGMLPCPFGEPGLHHKVIAEVTNIQNQDKIRFSQLSVHLIREHGFFEGKGSIFRLEPEILVQFIQ